MLRPSLQVILSFSSEALQQQSMKPWTKEPLVSLQDIGNVFDVLTAPVQACGSLL